MRAIKGTLQKMQYDVYDPVTDVSERASRVPLLLPDTLEAVRKAAQASELSSEDVGPARVSYIDSIVAPYAQCREKPHALAEIAAPSVPVLFEGAVRLGAQENGRISLSQMAVRTVFGASESTPVRALSYLLPGLHLVEAMRRSGKFSELPQVQYIVMGEVSTRMNGLSGDDVRRNADVLMSLGESYIDRYYPELRQNVIFVRDDGFLDHREVRRIRDLLQQNDATIGHPLLLPQTQNAYEYAALHALVHDTAYEQNPFTSDGDYFFQSPHFLINIGGQREKPFYKARMIFRDILADHGVPLIPSVQLFSTHRIPPYIPMEADGDHLRDITFDDVLADLGVFMSFDTALDNSSTGNNLLAQDYKLLKADSPFRSFPYFLSDTISDIRNRRENAN